MSRFCKIFLYLFMTHKSFAQILSYNCNSSFQSWCYLSEIKQVSSMKHFKVVPHQNTSEIKGVLFVDSVIEVLTEDVCDALPYIVEFSAVSIGLTAVDENTFNKCANLRNIQLDNNKLTEIDVNLFKYSLKLEEIYIRSNMLQKISITTELPALRKVEIWNNSLSDIDVDTLLQKCPNLKWFHFDDNKIPCRLVNKIVLPLEVKSINYNSGKCIQFTQDLKEIVAELQNKNSSSNITIIGTVVGLLILGLGIYCWGKKFRKGSDEPVGELYLRARNNVVSDYDYYNYSSSILNVDSLNVLEQPVLEASTHQQEGDYDHLNFSNVE